MAAVTSPAVLAPLRRSLVLAAAVASCSAVIGTALAWLVVRTDVPGRRVWRPVVALPLVIPSYVGASAMLAAFAPGGLVDELAGGRFGLDLPRVEGFWAALAVLTLLTYPYVYLPVAARLAALPPSLEESARLLGDTPVKAFTRVVLPQAAPAIRAGALLVALYTLSDFGAVQLLRYDTLTRAIYSSRLLPVSLTLSLVLALLALVVVAAERRLGERRAPTEASPARPPLRARLGAWTVPGAGLVGSVVTLSLVAPVAVLVWWAGRGVVAGRTRVGEVGGDLAALLGPALNTATVSVVAALAAVLAVLPVAFLVVRHHDRTGRVAHSLVVGGFALPGIVIALAVGYWALQAPAWLGLYQALPLLLFAYVVHFGAQSLRVAEVAVAGVPARLGEAARVLGAGPRRRLLTVDTPLMLPGLAAAAGLVLLSVMKELPATLLLAPIGFSTLATRIWGATEDGFLADAALASLVLLALSGALTWLLLIRQASRV